MTYFDEVKHICDLLDKNEIQKMLDILKNLKGRLFIIGVGGSAANASHAVNDFRKIASIEAYTPTDNVAELTARTNDDGWESVFWKWLQVSKMNEDDVLMVLSVGGGTSVSQNISQAVDYAKENGARVIGIVSRDGGHTKEYADACVLVPIVNEKNITPHAESFQAVIWHYLANNIR